MVRDLTAQRQIKKLSKQENNDIMFMANVAHDLRSPLNCMRGNNEIIQMSICEKDQQEVGVYFKRFND